jgi:cell division protein FtsQ
MKFRLVTIGITFIAISFISLLLYLPTSERALELSREYFPIKKVEIFRGSNFTDNQKIEDVVTLLLNKGFFLLDIVKIKQDLLVLPWVNKVFVQRKWPDSLKITLTEHSPIALWNNKGIVTQENKIIYPDQLPNVERLPKFFAQTQEVTGVLDTYLAIMSAVAPLGLSVESLQLMQDNGFMAELSNGIEIILGQDSFATKLSRFVLAYKNSIKMVEAKVAYVDLRYINGIAVGWKT